MNMKKIIYFLVLSFLLTACVEKKEGKSQKSILSNIIDVSKTEYKGVDEVLFYYGGVCNRRIGVSVNKTEKKTYFELEMMKSIVLEELADMIEMPSSNIAYIFYHNLNNEEKNKYSFIRVTVDFKDGSKTSNDFPVEKLAQLENNIDKLFYISKLISKSDYTTLFEKLDTDASKEWTISKLESFCGQKDIQFGQVDSIHFHGFHFIQKNRLREKEVLLLSGLQFREKQNTPFSIIIDPSKPVTEKILIKLRFQF